ncbi:MAG TPA: histidine phosphatase family protein [Candidatus Dormibacteraeota bacterium]
MSGEAAGARLYLVRHGAPAEWSAGRCCGRTDVPLSAAGLASADRLAAAFAAAGVDAVYSSPRRRATETASRIASAAGTDVSCLDGLAEIDFGAFEGRAFQEIAAASPELYDRWMSEPAAVRFPGGESYADVKLRATAALREIISRHGGARLVAVAHAGSIRAILGAVLEIPDHAIFRLDVALASVSVVDWMGEVPVVRGINLDAPHGG